MAPVPDGGARTTPVTPEAVSETPYLSVVVTARNDDHGGNLLGRMQAFVNGLFSQCRRFRVSVELVMVEWNPPPDRPPLAQVLDWGAQNEFCGVRIIEVPPELHQRFEHWQALPLYQMIAKNVGIRRARGEFILATNIDILFSDELFKILAARELECGKMYRADRWDVMADLPDSQPIEEQLAWCNSHLLRVNRRAGTFSLNPDGSLKIEAADIVSPERGVTIGANWFTREMSGEEPFRWVENDAELIIAQPGDAVLALDIEPGPGVEMEPFPLEIRDAAGAVMVSTVVERRSDLTLPLQLAEANSHVFLHTDYGGAKIAADLRTLNFRVFHCEIARGLPISAVPDSAAPEPTTVEHVAPKKSSGISFARLRRGLSALLQTFHSASEIRIPMSREALRRLNLKQDESSISFTLGPLFRRKTRPVRDDMITGGLIPIWGAGWYDFEKFRGEAFRWMRFKGALTVILPDAGGSRISLLVEAGPAVGFRGARVDVRDDLGQLLASAALNGRTTLEVPTAEWKGVATLHLSVYGSMTPKTLAGDTRTMALRLFRCELFPPAAEVDSPALFEAAPASGVWCVRGFKLRDSGLVCATRGEMAIRGTERVAFRISPNAARARLSIRTATGKVLHDDIVSPGQEIAIPGPGSGYLLLRFTADRPVTFASVTRTAPNVAPVRFAFGAATPHALHLHTNGCGDFTMMARGHWFDLRGYPEFDAFSMNIDSVLCWAAHHGGAREEMLPARIFHIEHGTGSGWTPEGEQRLFERITAKGLPWLDFRTVLDWAGAMNRLDLPMIFNSEHWGFERETLAESLPGRNACQARSI
jgi:hypothetical protein